MMKLLALDARQKFTRRIRGQYGGKRWSYLKIRLFARIAIATEFVVVFIMNEILSKA